MKKIMSDSFKTILCSLAIISTQACADDKTDNKAEVKTSGDKAEYYAHGEEIHQDHCLKCHTDQVYTRSDRFVTSINALGQQVERCKNGNNIPWFDEDTEAVVHFLNTKYYKF
ncbi:MAG: hypothetical protein WBN96_08980 [Gammaproteobacteria bacterium]